MNRLNAGAETLASAADPFHSLLDDESGARVSVCQKKALKLRHETLGTVTFTANFV